MSTVIADGALAGRTAAVTGASSGIGLATARRLHELGAEVTGLARREEAMAAGLPAGVATRALDVTDPAAATAVLGSIAALDVLVLAAGTNVPDRAIDRLGSDDFDLLVAANLTGVFACVSAALPALRRSRGLVVVVGSVSGSWPDRSGPGYQAAKAGALAFARAAQLEEHEAGTGVRFSVVAPGMVDTPLLERRPAPPPPGQRAQMLRPGDVAEACAFLAALPEHVAVPELPVLPHRLQVLGRTG